MGIYERSKAGDESSDDGTDEYWRDPDKARIWGLPHAQDPGRKRKRPRARCGVRRKRDRTAFSDAWSKRISQNAEGIFHRAIRDAGRQLPDEAFELIQFRNRQCFLDLLKSLESVKGVMAGTLRTMCRLQLDGLSQCYGM